MKRVLAMMTTLTVLGATSPGANAGDKEWATAGKVMVGVGAGLLLAKAFEPPPVYVNPAPVVVHQPAPVIVQQPAPVVVQQAPRTVVVQQAPPPQVIVQQPVVVQQPIVYHPAPVVYPAPVLYRPVYPPPVYYAPPPVYCAPRPAFGFHFSFGGHRRSWH